MKHRICMAVCAITAAFGVAHAQEDSANFHHIRLNVVDPAKSIEYYAKFFSAVPVKYRGIADAVLVDRSFILFNKVDEPAPSKMITAIYHIGWGGVDGPSEFEWRDKLGMKWETPLQTLGNNYYMYAYGPDDEVIEVWTGFTPKHERFGHVHLFSDDVAASHAWYKEHLGLNGPDRVGPKPPSPPADFDPSAPENRLGIFRFLWSSQVSTDNDVAINIFAKPSDDTINWWNYGPIDELVATDGRVINHIAFSFRDIEPVLERMKADGVEIVDGIKMREDFGFKSFFVRGPDKILIEILEEEPIPQGAWE